MGTGNNTKYRYKALKLKIEVEDKINKLKIKTGNSALKGTLKVREPNPNELNNLILTTAKVACEKCTNSKKRKDNKRKKPTWKVQIEKEIEQR